MAWPKFRYHCNKRGLLKIPVQWHDDITDLNTDIIESSFPPLEGTSYGMGEPTLSISGLTVFKQEAPSPTHDVNAIQQQLSRRNIQSPTSTQDVERGNTLDDNSNDQQILTSTISQLLNQSGYSSLHSAFDANLVGSSSSQDQYNVTSSNFSLSDDCRFQYVLAAATSIATKMNEDTLTYLNQGQSYEIKLKKLGDLSMYRGKMLKSVIRICFHERRLQYMEKEQMALWQKARPGDRILDVDVPLSYGAVDIVQPPSALNLIQFTWDPTKEVGIYIKVNCISTEFTPKKHGGEKGVPFRIQVETYPTLEGSNTTKRLHAAACQIKVFKLKGADRKHKQDREKIMKRPLSEQEKYQPSYECTVLNDIPSDAVLSSSPIAPLSPADSDSCSSIKSNPAPPSHAIAPSSVPVVSSLKQHPQQPMIQVVAPLQQVHNVPEQPKHGTQRMNYDQRIKVTYTTEQVKAWLIRNNFEKFEETFQNYSGQDMLRLSKSDCLQLCGETDGVRFYNVLHAKIVSPFSRIYVCKPNAKVFHAVFLASSTKEDLKNELCNVVGVSPNQVQELFMEGPNNIHIIVSDSVVYHIKDESAFTITTIKDKDQCVLLLKLIK
ncbi:transcription factor CP2-like protein 1 isoform X2 [Harmonia axyridis]|uniref:transcription factor CP2-like protein 1 isoform X2 n=1 Tax=Harmonia axyridis TaxID=115357 RepID=UPI001E276FBC|nr:transcription factor CP2-like protein 1 isoform X2 [Harmonia axyridis]